MYIHVFASEKSVYVYMCIRMCVMYLRSFHVLIGESGAHICIHIFCRQKEMYVHVNACVCVCGWVCMYVHNCGCGCRCGCTWMCVRVCLCVRHEEYIRGVSTQKCIMYCDVSVCFYVKKIRALKRLFYCSDTKAISYHTHSRPKHVTM